MPTLTELLKDTDWSIRSAAAMALGKIGCDAKTAIPMLTDLLKDKDEVVRRAAALALGNIGPEAKTAIPALTELLKENDWPVQWAAAESLGNIGPEASRPPSPPSRDCSQTRTRLFARGQPKPWRRSREAGKRHVTVIPEEGQRRPSGGCGKGAAGVGGIDEVLPLPPSIAEHSARHHQGQEEENRLKRNWASPTP